MSCHVRKCKIYIFFLVFQKNFNGILYVASIKWCLPSGLSLFYGNISSISISWSSLSRFLFISIVSLGWFFPWPSSSRLSLSLQQQANGGFLCDFRYPRDGSHPFLIPPTPRTGDRVLELCIINIGRELTNWTLPQNNWFLK